MSSEDIRDKETERLKRSIRASAITHVILIVILSIPIVRKEEETSPKLLEVCRVTEVESKEIRKKLEEKKAIEKKTEAAREIGKDSTEMEIKADDMGNKGDLDRELSGADDAGVDKSVRESGEKSYLSPSVGPQVGEDEKKGIIEAEVEITDDVSEVSAQDDKTGNVQPKSFLDKLRSSLIRHREKKRQEKKKKTNDIEKNSPEKSKSLAGQETDARIAIQDDISRDKARFLSYGKTYSGFGEEKDFNRIIDFSFSSDRARRSFFQKYDIKTIPISQIGEMTARKGDSGTTLNARAPRRNTEYYKVYHYYRNKYGGNGCHIGEEYIYMFPPSVNSIIGDKYYEKMSEKYGITDRKQIRELIKPIPKLVVVFEIDEKKLEFRIRELELFDIG